MAVRLTGRGVTSTNFSKPLFAVSGAMGAWKSRRESNSRREFDQLQEIAGEDSRDQGLSFLFFCRSHAVSSSHGVILTYGKSQSNDVKRGHSYIKVCFVSLIHGMRRNGNMSCVYSLQLNPFEWKN